MMKAACFLLALCLTVHAAADDWKSLDREGKKALEKNNFAAAEKYYMQAAGQGEKFGPKDERYASSFRGLGFAALQLRDYANADLAYTRLAYADGVRLGTNDLLVAEDLLHLTDVAGYTEQFLRGHESIDAATSIVASRFGQYSPAMGLCDTTRAGLELQENHLSEAETNFQKALQIFETKGTITHFSGPELQVKQSYFQLPQTFVAQVLNNLSICQLKEKKYGDAEACLLRALKILEHDYGKNSVQLVNSLDNLGNVYAADGKYPQAEEATRRALSLLGKVDPTHPMIRATREQLAKILTAEGKDKEAAKYRD